MVILKERMAEGRKGERERIKERRAEIGLERRGGREGEKKKNLDNTRTCKYKGLSGFFQFLYVFPIARCKVSICCTP